MRVNALSGCYLISTEVAVLKGCDPNVNGVNALSGCYLISTYLQVALPGYEINGVNALSGCYLISTDLYDKYGMQVKVCQCPLGLLPHFYTVSPYGEKGRSFVSMPSRAVTSFLR